jgi:hypothetical protein
MNNHRQSYGVGISIMIALRAGSGSVPHISLDERVSHPLALAAFPLEHITSCYRRSVTNICGSEHESELVSLDDFLSLLVG